MLAMWSRLLAAVHRDQRGQGTVEYVLVILAVTAVAIALISWVRGSGSGLLGALFSKIIGFVTGRAQF
jgi:Flp pilus assembly pilin Flp